MKTFLLACAFLMLAGSAYAEIHCLTERGDETLEVSIIDTFVDRSAFITRKHPTTVFPRVGFSVRAIEKSTLVTFVNEELDFNLKIDKRVYDRRLPPLYHGLLEFQDLAVPMTCAAE